MHVEAAPANRTVIAYNDAADSGNPMHDDEAARAMNFKSALVPGVTAFGFVTHAFVTHFGDAWLEQGSIEVRFRKPVYAGDSMSVESSFADDILTVELCNPEKEVCVIGRGTMARNSDTVPSIPSSPIAQSQKLPIRKLPAERTQFEADPVLGSIEPLFENSDADQFLDLLQDDHEIYRTGITHPAWLLRQANIIVDQNYAIGPWIHVASEIRNHAFANNDEPIEVRAQVIDLFERKGNEYFDLDVAILAAGDPDRLIMRVMHRAIYKMGKTGS